MQKITTFLWFDSQAEEAVNFYISIFKNSKIRTIRRYGDAGPGPKGSVMIVTFSTRRAGVYSSQRRSALFVYPGHLAARELRDPSGG
jgi:predicted 3-demethylubiquinone-9 3-methyltransferase (glyoxalase superfamily)